MSWEACVNEREQGCGSFLVGMNEIEAVGAEIDAESRRWAALCGRRPSERPWVFGLLIAPSAVIGFGLVQGGALAFLMRRQGVSVERIGAVISLLILPQTLYFLWSPITDFLMRRRTWVMVGATCAAVADGAGVSCSRTLARRRGGGGDVPERVLRAAGGVELRRDDGGAAVGASEAGGEEYYQAGSLGLGGLAASVLVSMSARTGQDMLGLVAAAMIGIPALFALAAPKQETIVTMGWARRCSGCGRSSRRRSFAGRRCLISLMMFPIASGSAVGLLTGVAIRTRRQWG